MKLLLIVIAALVAYWILRHHYRAKSRRGRNAPAAREDHMVRCEHCGVHFPLGESQTSAPPFFCSAEHRRLHQQRE